MSDFQEVSFQIWEHFLSSSPQLRVWLNVTFFFLPIGRIRDSWRKQDRHKYTFVEAIGPGNNGPLLVGTVTEQAVTLSLHECDNYIHHASSMPVPNELKACLQFAITSRPTVHFRMGKGTRQGLSSTAPPPPPPPPFLRSCSLSEHKKDGQAVTLQRDVKRLPGLGSPLVPRSRFHFASKAPFLRSLPGCPAPPQSHPLL